VRIVVAHFDMTRSTRSADDIHLDELWLHGLTLSLSMTDKKGLLTFQHVFLTRQSLTSGAAR
jgi:hypothetical protein